MQDATAAAVPMPSTHYGPSGTSFTTITNRNGSASTSPPAPLLASSSSTPPLHQQQQQQPFPSVAIDPDRERYPFCIVWTPLPVISWILPFIGHMGICDSRGVIYDFAGPYFISRNRMAFGNPAKYWPLYEENRFLFPAVSSSSSSSPASHHLPADVSPRSFLGLLVRLWEHNTDTTSKGCPVLHTHSGASNKASSSSSQSIMDVYDAALYSVADHFCKTQMYNFFCNNCHSFVAHVMERAELLALTHLQTTYAPHSVACCDEAVPRHQQRPQQQQQPPVSLQHPQTPISNNNRNRSEARSILQLIASYFSHPDAAGTHTQPPPPIHLPIWTMVTLTLYVFFFGRYVSVGRFLLAHIPFAIVLGLCVGFYYMSVAVADRMGSSSTPHAASTAPRR